MEERKYAVFYGRYYNTEEQVSHWMTYDDVLMFYNKLEDKEYMSIYKDVTPEKE